MSYTNVYNQFTTLIKAEVKEFFRKNMFEFLRVEELAIA